MYKIAKHCSIGESVWSCHCFRDWLCGGTVTEAFHVCRSALEVSERAVWKRAKTKACRPSDPAQGPLTHVHSRFISTGLQVMNFELPSFESCHFRVFSPVMYLSYFSLISMQNKRRRPARERRESNPAPRAGFLFHQSWSWLLREIFWGSRLK